MSTQPRQSSDVPEKDCSDYALELSECKRTEAQILKLNAELEQRVTERTRQLEAANKELEAFSYSVSHDLRAPLRGIDGFSQILLKKYAGQLDATGSDYLQRIRNASTRMGELIEDLLKLSRVSRAKVAIEKVDLTPIAKSILSELADRDPQRRVATEVQDGVEVGGDPRLLRVALENLLGNAWKFTGKRDASRIAFGVREQDGEQAVFVEDNGAGFDMKYAHKLFGAFQRLHGAAEFEGTGIGLATVQRIINLHGGRIWADSTPGKGATFYFVIPRAHT
jgi:light-regulated signal transduction histidine kinase (bacteriophytochrome)